MSTFLEKDFGDGIHALDADYHRSHHTAIHLIVEQGHAAIVETGANNALPRIEASLARLDVAPEAVDYVIVTHVHLDHAGGAGQALRRFPNARLVVHPRGARHMIDPAKLVAGATAVYGEAAMRATYGEVIPVPAERVIEAGDDFVLDFHGRPLRFLDTPGHARHHFCLWDERSRAFFTGDTFGISYREFDVDGRAFIYPTTSPVQFDPEAARTTLDRLLAFAPRQMFLAHFSRVGDPARAGAELHRWLDVMVAEALALKDAGEARHARLKARLAELYLDALAAHGCTLSRETAQELIAIDLELNAQGLGVWLDEQ